MRGPGPYIFHIYWCRDSISFSLHFQLSQGMGWYGQTIYHKAAKYTCLLCGCAVHIHIFGHTHGAWKGLSHTHCDFAGMGLPPRDMLEAALDLVLTDQLRALVGPLVMWSWLCRQRAWACNVVLHGASCDQTLVGRPQPLMGHRTVAWTNGDGAIWVVWQRCYHRSVRYGLSGATQGHGAYGPGGMASWLSC